MTVRRREPPVHRREAAEFEPASSFDIREFTRTAVGSHRDELQLSEYDARPLEPATLRCLRYLRDLERSILRYLRHVLVTPTHKDARVTAFLTTWAYEKYWIADALNAILDHHQYQPPPAGRRSAMETTWRRVRDRLAPIGRSLVDNTIGSDVVAVHMTTGTIDEWLTQAAYRRVAQLDEHPELSRTIDRILGIKSRHLTFFHAEAQDRLRRSWPARWLTRTRLRRSSWPISVEDEPPAEDAYFFGRLFATAPVLVRDIDRRVQTLPGLERLALVQATVAARRNL